MEKTKNITTVSIGMPVYNGAQFIREALDSLLAQTFTDFELIISDNASTDETEAVCREYAGKDSRIRYIRQMENLGMSANFKYVAQEAVGQYFMWAAADDKWSPKWIETLLPISTKYQCLSYGNLMLFDEKGKQQRWRFGRFKFSGNKFLRRMQFALEPFLLGKVNPIYGLIPRQFLTPEIVSVLKDSEWAPDLRFVYNILNLTEIRSDKTVFLEKRNYSGNGGGELNFQPRRGRNFFTRIYLLLKNTFLSCRKQSQALAKLSTNTEKILHIFFFPLAFLLELYQNLKFQILIRIKRF